MKVDAIETPALLLDRARLERNCARMRQTISALGARLRPHLKTAKSSEVARVAQGDSDTTGIAVATLEEAEYFAARGHTDLLLAVGLVPHKVARVAALALRGVTIGILVEGPKNAARVSAAAGAFGVTLPAYVEVDVGQGRGGHGPDDAALLATARSLDEGSGTRLAGVLSHAGQSYSARSQAARREVAEHERRETVRAAERIRAEGMSCPEVSIGSTPTALSYARLDGVTEVRAGVYVFFDRFQQALGVCDGADLALSVIASVISARADAFWIDAGTLSLSSERSLEAWEDRSYGAVTALDGAPFAGELIVDAINQEHGRVVATEGPLPRLEIGDRVRVWPNHACITAAMFDRYHVLERGDIAETWERLRG